jgi:membrane-bound lytic murein transglycosylase B
MPCTWEYYRVDCDGDGDTDIYDPFDSIWSAAKVLYANGAGATPHWWNHTRLHSSCGNIPPAEFESAYYASLEEASDQSIPII